LYYIKSIPRDDIDEIYILTTILCYVLFEEKNSTITLHIILNTINHIIK